MPSTRDIKRRQKSVKNTKQVTRAMQMVAASKMRKSQLVALQSRPYAQKAIDILAHIKQRKPDLKNMYLDGVESKKILALVVTSDKGLCGGLNSAIIRESQKFFNECKKDGSDIELALVGVNSKSYFERMKLPILDVRKGAGDYIELDQVKPIAEFIQAKYKTGAYAKVVAVYTNFISTLKQKVARRQILPITTVSDSWHGETHGGQEYIFEPNAETVVDTLIPFLLDIYIYHIILESNASEHSARMVAMKNATDSAENILSELTLSYNKARQAAITREITEITAGVEALK